MCGICGFIQYDRSCTDREEGWVRQMNNRLYHRGPDAQQVLLHENLALGFSRLSIIGLENGMQPLTNEDGSLLLVCNGEIFNYVELKEELRKRGHIFRTESDVEVILHLYEEEGISLLDKLNGQFAFVLFDKRTRQLYSARDQFGVIPFFYTQTKDAFVFGSEIKAILEYPGVTREVDRVGLDQVMTFAGLISPRTMFKDICSLPNGHYLRVDDQGRLTVTEYWDLIFPEGEVKMNGKPEHWYVERLEQLFESSLQERLRTDVPLGIYLSGGLDSSMIAMKMSRLEPNRRKEAFSIDFIDSRHSESVYQELVAAESNFELNKKTFFSKDIIGRLKDAIYYSECPIKETYNTASLSLSESVRSKGIKVILSGEGADEFFAGYVGYRFDKIRQMNPELDMAGQDERDLRHRLWGDADFYYERNFLEYEQVRRSLYSKEINEQFDDINCLNHFVVNKDRLENRDILNRRAYIDYKIRLVDHLVSDHGDRMALANSVEVRYPFLDRRLVEFAASLPAELKLNDLTEKYILRLLARDLVPGAILEREKFHFIAPGSPWLLQKEVPYFEELLSYDKIKKQGFFNPDKIEELKRLYKQPDFTINAPYENDLLIVVLTFGIFLDTFFNH